MAAGLFGYLGYDMVRLVERLPDVNPDPLGLPDALMLRPSVVLVVDGVKGEVTVVSPAWAGSGLSARAAYAQAAERVMDAVRDLDRTPSAGAGDAAGRRPASRSPTPAAPATSRWSRRRRTTSAPATSSRWCRASAGRCRSTLPPFALYRALRRTNPSPFMFYFNFGGFQVIGASPEILVRVKGDTVTIRPIAGTRPRGATPAEDRALEAELLADPKERAEHLMLLDLGRNDVGRVARIGSGRSERAVHHRALQPRHAHRLERRRRARRRARTRSRRCSPACPPARSPARRRCGRCRSSTSSRAEKRGVYGGGVGYFDSSGNMDTCIALRTAVVKDGTLYIQAGGGVVYDSDPEAEYEETRQQGQGAAPGRPRRRAFLGGRGAGTDAIRRRRARSDVRSRAGRPRLAASGGRRQRAAAARRRSGPGAVRQQRCRRGRRQAALGESRPR